MAAVNSASLSDASVHTDMDVPTPVALILCLSILCLSLCLFGAYSAEMNMYASGFDYDFEEVPKTWWGRNMPDWILFVLMGAVMSYTGAWAVFGLQYVFGAAGPSRPGLLALSVAALGSASVWLGWQLRDMIMSFLRWREKAA